jgi:hypothetical protein
MPWVVSSKPSYRERANDRLKIGRTFSNDFLEDLDLTDDRLKWVDINAKKAFALPVVRVKHAPLPGAEADGIPLWNPLTGP